MAGDVGGYFGGRDTKSVQIDVLNVNNAPVLDPIGDRSIERGTQAGINVSGDDPDGGDRYDPYVPDLSGGLEGPFNCALVAGPPSPA